MPSRACGTAFFFSGLSLRWLLPALKKWLSPFVKRSRRIMRGIIIRSISPEEVQAIRHLQAVEGYADLGMYEEADAELRELDRAWLALEQTLSLQLRVYAGLNQCK